QPTPDVSRGQWTLTRLLIPTVELPMTSLAETPWCVEYRVETPPIRGPAPTDVPAPGVTRIAGIGDSFAMGEGVPYEKTRVARRRVRRRGDGDAADHARDRRRVSRRLRSDEERRQPRAARIAVPPLRDVARLPRRAGRLPDDVPPRRRLPAAALPRRGRPP